MTEEQTPGTEEQPSETEDMASGTEERVSSSEILDELHSLGQQLATTVRSLWESNESRKLRQDIEQGFVELGHQVERHRVVGDADAHCFLFGEEHLGHFAAGFEDESIGAGQEAL